MNTANATPMTLHLNVGDEYPDIVITLPDGSEPEGQVRADAIEALRAASIDGTWLDKDYAPRLDLDGTVGAPHTVHLAVGIASVSLARKGYAVVVRQVESRYDSQEASDGG